MPPPWLLMTKRVAGDEGWRAARSAREFKSCRVARSPRIPQQADGRFAPSEVWQALFIPARVAILPSIPLVPRLPCTLKRAGRSPTKD